jgi:hypothetical protein
LSSLPREEEPWLKWRWLADYQNHSLASRLGADAEPYLVKVPEKRYLFADFLDPSPYTPPGSPWYVMDRQPRCSMVELRFAGVPESPGVYAVYREGQQVYVGETSSLHTRICRCHLSQSRTMTTSALRRNVAEYLGVATAAAIKSGAHTPTPQQVAAIGAWMAECDIAWVDCESKKEAMRFERELRQQRMPPLNKI